MFYIIFFEKSAAQQLIDNITSKNIESWSKRNTSSYSDIIIHPTQKMYAVIIEPKYQDNFPIELIKQAVTLDSSWFPIPKRK